jgi:hypothetical protein
MTNDKTLQDYRKLNDDLRTKVVHGATSVQLRTYS